MRAALVLPVLFLVLAAPAAAARPEVLGTSVTRASVDPASARVVWQPARGSRTGSATASWPWRPGGTGSARSRRATAPSTSTSSSRSTAARRWRGSGRPTRPAAGRSTGGSRTRRRSAAARGHRGGRAAPRGPLRPPASARAEPVPARVPGGPARRGVGRLARARADPPLSRGRPAARVAARAAARRARRRGAHAAVPGGERPSPGRVRRRARGYLTTSFMLWSVAPWTEQ